MIEEDASIDAHEQIDGSTREKGSWHEKKGCEIRATGYRRRNLCW